MEEKAQALMNAMHGQLDDITTHTVSADWYRMHVDMDYHGNEPVEIVEFTYNPDLYACPQHITLAEFNYKSVSELKALLEI